MSKELQLLLVSADKLFRKELSDFLIPGGYQVYETSSEYECLHMTREKKPDMVVIDALLANADVPAVCNQIKTDAELADVAVVIASSPRKVNDDQIKVFETCADGFIAYPFDNYAYLTCLRVFLRLKQSEKACRISQERFELAVQGSNDGIWEWDIGTSRAYLSDRGYAMLGYQPLELPQAYETWVARLHPDDRDRVMKCLRQHLEERFPFDLEYRFCTKNGGYRWFRARGQAIWDKEGKPIRMAGSFCDITAEKQAEEELQHYRQNLEKLIEERTVELQKINERLIDELDRRRRMEEQISASLAEKELLLKEIHHRVKNNLQIISSLLNLQCNAMGTKPPSEVFQECQNRIQSLSLIHESLYQSPDLARIEVIPYMHRLVSNLAQTYPLDPKLVKTIIQGDDFLLDINKAIPCGFILNELVANSFKYAFPQGHSGEIVISILKHEAVVIIRIRDNGIGLPPDFAWQEPKTFGLRIVKLLVQQLRGSIEYTVNNGTAFTFSFPDTPDNYA